MKRIIHFLIIPFLFLSCRKDADEKMLLLTQHPWRIDKYTRTIIIDNRVDTVFVVPPTECNYYGTIELNRDFSGKMVSDCQQEFRGTWTFKNDTLDLMFTPPGTTVTGFVFPDAAIKLLNKEHLELENTRIVTGIDPATNQPDTLIRLERIYMSH